MVVKSGFKSFFEKDNITLQLMVFPAFLAIFLFCYLPMFGVIIAFKDYSIPKGILGSPWIGLKNFFEMFNDTYFYISLRNTLVLSLLGFLFCFPAPIILAIVFNEAPFRKFKRLVQTSSYLPHFLSYVVVASLWTLLLDKNGLVNNLLLNTGLIKNPVEFWTDPNMYWPLAIILNLWQGTGWGAIIYLAAITNLNEEVYEAAIVDGAGRLRRIISIILPTISSTIVIMLIFSISGLFRSNFDQSYLLGNPFNRDRSYVLEYYVVDMGLNLMRYSFATAVNLVQSTISILLLLGANFVSRKVNDNGLF